MAHADRTDRGATDLLTIEEVAGHLALPLATVARLAEQGDLPGHTVGGQQRFHRWVVDAWRRRHATGARHRVLVIDDHREVRDVLADLLATDQREILVAASGEEAVAIVKTTDVDLVLLDLSLPGLDGAQTFQAIRALHPGVPVVIVTGYPDSEAMARALEIGPFTVISKPVHMDHMQRVVEHILRS